MKCGFWYHCNFCIYEDSCYLANHSRATDFTFLCSEYCAVQRIPQNVYPGSHRRSFPSLGGLLPSLTSHFSVMTSLRKSIQCGRIEECLLYLKYSVTRKTPPKPFSNFRVIVPPINIVWDAIFWGNIGRYANPHDNDDDDDESRD